MQRGLSSSTRREVDLWTQSWDASTAIAVPSQLAECPPSLLKDHAYLRNTWNLQLGQPICGFL